MSKIKKLILKSNYRIIWLRYVNGVNLKEHCMKSLLGRCEPKVKWKCSEYNNIELDLSPYYYFCAVHAGWNYQKNVHIAWKDSEGKSFIIDNDLVYAEIEGAERIDINPDSIDADNPLSKNKLFSTCRNWQFANWLAKNDENIKRDMVKYKQIKLW